MCIATLISRNSLLLNFIPTLTKSWIENYEIGMWLCTYVAFDSVINDINYLRGANFVVISAQKEDMCQENIPTREVSIDHPLCNRWNLWQHIYRSNMFGVKVFIFQSSHSPVAYLDLQKDLLTVQIIFRI